MTQKFLPGDFVCYLHCKEERYVALIVKQLSPYAYLVELKTTDGPATRYETYQLEVLAKELFPIEEMLLSNQVIEEIDDIDQIETDELN